MLGEHRECYHWIQIKEKFGVLRMHFELEDAPKFPFKMKKTKFEWKRADSRFRWTAPSFQVPGRVVLEILAQRQGLRWFPAPPAARPAPCIRWSKRGLAPAPGRSMLPLDG